MNSWDNEKEFSNLKKLTEYLNKIQDLDRAEINNVDYRGYSTLSFNLKKKKN